MREYESPGARVRPPGVRLPGGRRCSYSEIEGKEKALKRSIFVTLAAFFALTLGASAAMAVTFHAGPSFTDQGGGYTARLFADVSGLGNTDLVGTIDFAGLVQYTCQNKGGNTAPGQPTQQTSSAVQTVHPQAKNGRAVLDLTASFSPPATVPGNTIGCPNGNWTGINPVILGPVFATGTITWGNQTLFGPTTIEVTA